MNRNTKPDEDWAVLVQNNETYSRYEVSNYGRVWDNKNDREVSQVETGKPVYKYVNLTNDSGKRVLRRVHNIVSWSFLGNPPSGSHTSDHIDRDKFNNKLENLRWLNKKGQMGNRDCNVVCSCGNTLISLIHEAFPEKTSQVGAFMYKHLSLCNHDFSKLKVYYEAYAKYGRSWNNKITINGGTCLLFTLLDKFNLDIKPTIRLLRDGLSFEEIVRGCVMKQPEYKEFIYSYEVGGVWFPNKNNLCSYYCISRSVLNDRLKGLGS